MSAQPKSPVFDRTVTIGNIVSWVITIAIFSVFVGRQEGAAAEMRERQNRLDARISIIEKEQARDISQIKIDVAVISRDVKNLTNVLAEFRDEQRRITTQNRSDEQNN